MTPAEKFYAIVLGYMAAVVALIAALVAAKNLCDRRNRRKAERATRFDRHVADVLAIIRANEQQAREDKAWGALLAAVQDVEAADDFELWDAEVSER